MTIEEKQTLGVALDFLREWREDDKAWKDRTDHRLRALEERNLSIDAVAGERAERANASHRLRERLVGGGLTAAGGLLAAVASSLLSHR